MAAACSGSSGGGGPSQGGSPATVGGTNGTPAGGSSGTATGGVNGNTTGGVVTTGGAVATGGAPIAGGASVTTGGAKATGGAPNATGGMSAATGGIKATGGAPIAAGGASVATGGQLATGGTLSATGGMSAATGGIKATGGAPAATGGASAATGGTKATGGAPNATGGTHTATGGTNTGGPSYPYIFANFNDAAAVSSLMIYTSNDALNFTLLLDTGYGGPTGNLRDPSIMKHTDGIFYIVHTTPPSGTGCCGAETSFNVAKSADLKNWTTVTQVPCGVANTTNVWAPEWFKDSDGSLHVLVSVDQKTYRYEPTDNTFTKWSAGTWIGIGPGYIDTFMVKLGTTYHAFTKHESVTYVEHATSTSLDGPWNFIGSNDWAGWGNHKEAPCLIQLANGNWRFYADAGSAGHEMYSDSTDTFATWTKPVTLPGVGNNISHGTVIKGN